MAYQFQRISERDLAKGIDQRSTENTLQEGYAEVLDNVDTNSNGFLSKRPGYEGYYGAVPIRVLGVKSDSAENVWEFVLETNVNVAFLPSSPIVINGKLSIPGSGDWSTAASTANTEYYSGFFTGIPDTWEVAASPFTLLGTRHQQATDELLIGSLQSTSSSVNDNKLIISDVTINNTSYNVDYEYIIPDDIKVFVFADSKSTVPGSSYSGPFDNLSSTVGAGATEILEIAQGTHSLDNLSVIMSVYEEGGATDREIQCKVQVDTVGVVGKITAEIQNGSGGAKTYRAVVSSAPIANTASSLVSASSFGSIIISNFTDNFYHINVYKNQSGILTKVIPDSILHDDVANTITVTVYNSSSVAETYEVFYETATITANSIKVNDNTGSVTSSIDDTSPQITIWGIPHSEIYTTTAAQEGHVTHIDSFRRSNEQRIVAGLGGNIFTAQTRAEAGTEFAIPSNVVNLQSTVAVDADIAPAFAREVSFVPGDISTTTDTLNIIDHGYSTGDPVSFTTAPAPLSAGTKYYAIVADKDNLKVAANLSLATAGTALDISGTATGTLRAGDIRTRNRVYSPDVNRAGGAKITAVTRTGAGVVDYTISLSDRTGGFSAALSDLIDFTTPLQDKLTVTGMHYPVNNGTFVITNVTETTYPSSTAEIIITCQNSAATLDDFNETNTQGRGAVYTDRFTVAATTEYLVGDQILGSVFTGKTVTVIETFTDVGPVHTIVLDGITEGINVPSGLKIFGKRTTDVIPLEGTADTLPIAATEGVEGFVRNDMCTVTGLSRRVRVKFVNPSGDLTVSTITVTNGTALVTLTSAHLLRVGQKALLLRTGVEDFNGEKIITQTSDETGTSGTNQFSFATTSTGSATTGTLKGNTLEIDEEISIQDDGNSPTTVAVEGRWIPVEAPETDDDLPDDTYYRHFDSAGYTTQSILRSGVVNDNMYFTNSEDEIHKFDGTNVYQAGIFRWQPHLFVQVDTTTGSIVANTTSAGVSAVSGNKFTVGAGESAQFTPGDRIIHDNDSALYTVQSIVADGTNFLVFVTGTISGAGSGNINLLDRYRYYFRLNAIDANQNIIASAATGADDFIVELAASGQIKMRLVGFPVWGNYDYDTLELEIYRTRANTSADYRLIQTLDIDFSSGLGYIDFTDATDDISIDFLQNDTVHTALKGAELGTGWTHPLRAKYLTVSDNVMLLANIKDYPQLDIQILPTADFAEANLEGKKLLFRKDSADAGIITNMVNRVTYEFRNVGSVTITPDSSDITTTATDFTIADGSHTLVEGDWVYLFHAAASTINDLTFAGWWQVKSVVASTSFTINFSGHDRGVSAAGIAADVDTYVSASTSQDVPVWVGTDGNYNQLNGNTFSHFLAMTRLANAVNCTMRVTDTTVSTGFVPWMVANAGSEYNAGQVVIRQEKVESTTMTVTTPDTFTNLRWFVQGINRAISTEVSASTQIFTSRILVSYPNFPEIFDNPFGDSTASDSAVDINAADGQEITGIIPFFGRAVFGASQIEGVVVVFKTNSIYLLDVTSRQFTKIQSRGLGCTAPFSIATTRDGIMFANESGIYRLNRDQSISYVGKYVERIWEDSVNRDNLSRATGHHYAIGRKYKLSVPSGTSQTTNNEVLVYDHQREGKDQEFGAWSRYTNHSATGWTNLANDAFFATTTGEVFKVRVAGDASDFRDDGGAVADMVILLRANDFGHPGSRKIIKNVVAHFQLRRSSMTATAISSSSDLDGVFTSAGSFSMIKDATIKVDTESVTLPRRRLIYIQIKIENSTKDEEVVLAGLDYNVALLSEHGIKEIED